MNAATFKMEIRPSNIDPKFVSISARWSRDDEPQGMCALIPTECFASDGIDAIIRMVIEIVGYENIK
jgi:hypothetical protein